MSNELPLIYDRIEAGFSNIEKCAVINVSKIIESNLSDCRKIQLIKYVLRTHDENILSSSKPSSRIDLKGGDFKIVPAEVF